MRPGHCLCLQVDPQLLRDWEALCKSAGVELRAQFPASLGAGQLLVSEGGYVLTHVAADQAGGPLSPSVPAASIIYPPLVAVTDGPPPPALVELLRLQGAVVAIGYPFGSESAALDLPSLAHSADWPHESIERLPVADALERAEMKRYMLVIACAHRKPLSPVPWSARLRECQQNEACSGWFARLYVSNGMVTHAEAPGAVGVDAIAKLARLEKGSFRFFPVFLEPREPASCGKVSDVVGLLRVNNRPTIRPIPAAAPAPPPLPLAPAVPSAKAARAVPRPVARDKSATVDATNEDHTAQITLSATQTALTAPPPDQLPEQERSTPMDGVKKLLSAASGLKCAARSDSGGSVLDAVGQFDAEQLCAVVAMSHAPLEHAAETLGVGKPQRWAIVTPSAAIYVDMDPNGGFVVVTGDSNKNPDTTLQKIHSLVG